jgi:1,4-dihydroxy-2-naphthoyl-CoA synthase
MAAALAARALRPMVVRAHQPLCLVVQGRQLSSTNYEFIKTDLAGTDNRVGLVTLNRPKALNALNSQLMDELIQALNDMDNDPTVGAIVLTGSEKVGSLH